MNMPKNSGRIGALFLILICALGFRIAGLSWGLPLTLNNSETEFVERALQMTPAYTGQNDFNPYFFDYPTFYIYLMNLEQRVYFYVGRLCGWWNSSFDFLAHFFAAKSIFYLLGRSTTVIFALATIYFTYYLGEKYLAVEAGLWGALFLAISPLNIYDSHLVTADVPVLLFIVLTTYYCLKYYEDGKTATGVKAGIFLGLGIGTKYLPGLLLGTLVLAHFLGPRKKTQALFWGLASVGLAFLATTPYALLEWATFLAHFFKVTDIMYHEKEGLRLINKNPFYYLYPIAFTKMGWGLLLLSIGGGYLAIRDSYKKALVLLFFPLSYLLVISGWGAKYPRYLLPIEPFAFLLAGYAIFKLRPLAKGKNWVSLVIISSIIFLPLKNSWLVDKEFVLPDVRLRAKEWLEKNIPADKLLVIEDHHALPINSMVDVLVELDKATNVKAQEEILKYYIKQKVYLDTWITWTASQYHLSSYPVIDYFLVSSEYITMFNQAPKQYQEQLKFYQELKDYAALAQVFQPSERESGPTIYLYAALQFPQEAGYTAKQVNRYLTITVFNLGNAYLRLKYLDQAANHYKAALRITPAYVSALTNLGIVYLKKNQIPQARELFNKAIELEPRTPFARQALERIAAMEK